MALFPVQTPATCELCGSWLPQHQSNCPRNGVHPSQWSPTALSNQHPHGCPTNVSDYLDCCYHYAFPSLPSLIISSPSSFTDNGSSTLCHI